MLKKILVYVCLLLALVLLAGCAGTGGAEGTPGTDITPVTEAPATEKPTEAPTAEPTEAPATETPAPSPTEAAVVDPGITPLPTFTVDDYAEYKEFLEKLLPIYGKPYAEAIELMGYTEADFDETDPGKLKHTIKIGGLDYNVTLLFYNGSFPGAMGFTNKDDPLAGCYIYKIFEPSADITSEHLAAVKDLYAFTRDMFGEPVLDDKISFLTKPVHIKNNKSGAMTAWHPMEITPPEAFTEIADSVNPQMDVSVAPRHASDGLFHCEVRAKFQWVISGRRD